MFVICSQPLLFSTLIESLPAMYSLMSRSTPPQGSDEYGKHIPLPFPYYCYDVDFALALEAALDRFIINYQAYQRRRASDFGCEVDWPQNLTPPDIRADFEKRMQELLLDFQTSVTPESDTLTPNTKDTPPLSCDGKPSPPCLQTVSSRPELTFHRHNPMNKKRTAEELKLESEDSVLNEQPPIKKRKSDPATPPYSSIEESLHGSAMPCNLEQANGKKIWPEVSYPQFLVFGERYE